VFFVRVGPEEVEEELIGCGLGDEVVGILEVFDFIELAFDLRPWGDGVVVLAGDFLDGLGVRARGFGGDRPEVFGAVIGLSGGVG
jgi:hypothetical protein